MKVAVLGSGMVGRSLSSRLAQLGHTVTMGTRDINSSLANTKSMINGKTLQQWLSNQPSVNLQAFSDAVEQADIVFLATSGAVIKTLLSGIEVSAFDKKIVVDVSNYLEFSGEDPLPSLKHTGSSSLGEELQKILPSSYVVKTLNHVEHSLMVNPELVPGEHNVFMAGNSQEAKELVQELLQSFGWKQKQIIDLGGIEFARAMEAQLLLWCRLYQLLGTGNFNFELKIASEYQEK